MSEGIPPNDYHSVFGHLSKTLNQESRLSTSKTTPRSALRAPRDTKEDLEALRNEITAALVLLPSDGRPPGPRDWEKLAERMFSLAATSETLGRRCRTEARRAHTEQR